MKKENMKLVIMMIFVFCFCFILITTNVIQNKNKNKFIHDSKILKFNNNTVNPSTSKYIDIPKSKNDDTLNLIIIVLSTPSDVISRTNIRHTWSHVNSLNSYENFKYKVYFVVGYEDNASLKNIIEENIKYGDIIIFNELNEKYENLGRKLIMALRYINYEHPKTLFVAKTDTDTLVNMKLLISHLSDIQTKSIDYEGCILENENIHKDKKHPNYEPNDVNFGSSKYHPFARGYGYLVRASLLPCMVKAASSIPPYKNEDTYAGAMVKFCSGKYLNSPNLFSELCALNMNNLKLDENINLFKECLFIHRIKKDNYQKYYSLLKEI